MTRGWPRGLGVALCALTVLSCGTGTETAGIDRGGVRAPVTAEGPITGFGSIVIGGVHYDVDHASIRIDGENASGADLALGQLVTVVGERGADETVGVANTVSLRTNVRGPVERVDLANSELTVLGQRVRVGSSTVLDLAGATSELASIHVGDRVAVSGFFGSRGLIDATRIESVAAGAEFLVVGVVSDLDAAALHFDIAALVVDYRGALLVEGFASGGPRNGDRVVVKGTVAMPGGPLLARELELLDDPESGAAQGSEAEVEGLITRFVSPLDFDVSGRRVSAPAATKYEGGGASALALNVKVEVHGTRDAAGVIVASKIEIKDGGVAVDD